MNKHKFLIVIIFTAFMCIVFSSCTVVALELYSEAFVKIDGSRFGRTEGFWDNVFYQYLTWDDVDQIAYAREEVRFRSGKNRLQGFVYGGNNNNGLIVISEGFGATADAYLPVITYFVDRGWRVFAYNNTGVGWSEGENVRGIYQSLIDLDAALTYIENTNAFNGLPVMLLGHSWGGYAVCAILNYNHTINAVASFAGFNDGSEVVKERGMSMVGGAYYLVEPQMWAIEKELFGEATNLTAIDGINRTNVPVLIVQCSNDDVIRADTVSIYAHRGKIASRDNVEIIYRDGEDATGHEYIFGSKEQRDYLALADASWVLYQAEHSNATKKQWALDFGFDKTLASELDSVIMGKVNTLFNDNR